MAISFGRFVATFAAVVLAVAAPCTNALAQPTPAPSWSPSPLPHDLCAGAPFDFASVSISGAFARVMFDRPTLRFLDRLARTDGRPLARLVRGVLAQPPPGVPSATDVAGDCRVADIPFAVRRAWTIARLRWQLSGERTDALLPHLGVAIDALARRDRLDPALVSTALAPFGTTVAELEAEPPAPVTCLPPREAQLDGPPAQPYYPVGALGNTSVDVKVTLTPDGFVRAATFYHSTYGARSDASFGESAIGAAGVSSYIPEVVNCQSIGGTYIFRASYTR